MHLNYLNPYWLNYLLLFTRPRSTEMIWLGFSKHRLTEGPLSPCVLSASSRLVPAGSHGRGKSPKRMRTQSLLKHPLRIDTSSILFAKTSHKASPDSRIGEINTFWRVSLKNGTVKSMETEMKELGNFYNLSQEPSNEKIKWREGVSIAKTFMMCFY